MDRLGTAATATSAFAAMVLTRTLLMRCQEPIRCHRADRRSAARNRAPKARRAARSSVPRGWGVAGVGTNWSTRSRGAGFTRPGLVIALRTSQSRTRQCRHVGDVNRSAPSSACVIFLQRPKKNVYHLALQPREGQAMQGLRQICLATALVAVGPAPASAQEMQAEVIHWWTSGGESAARQGVRGRLHRSRRHLDRQCGRRRRQRPYCRHQPDRRRRSADRDAVQHRAAVRRDRQQRLPARSRGHRPSRQVARRAARCDRPGDQP